MLEVEISIGRASYKISCRESDRERVLELAGRLNERVNSLLFRLRGIDDPTLFAMAALTMEDEIEDLKTAAKNAPKQEMIENKDEGKLALFDGICDRIENITRSVRS